MLAATTTNSEALNQVYNIALGDRTTLNELYKLIVASLAEHYQLQPSKLSYRDFRTGDVRHSLADISKAQTFLDYVPAVKIGAGIAVAMPWYVSKVAVK